MNLNHTIIGALHLAPLHGYEEFPGEKQVIELALADLQAFPGGGVDAIIYENNYDLPHHDDQLQMWWDGLCCFHNGDAVVCVGGLRDDL